MNRNQRKYLSLRSPKTTKIRRSCTEQLTGAAGEQARCRDGCLGCRCCLWSGHSWTPPAPARVMGTAVPCLPGQEVWGKSMRCAEIPPGFYKGHRKSGPEHPLVQSGAVTSKAAPVCWSFVCESASASEASPMLDFGMGKSSLGQALSTTPTLLRVLPET